MKELAVFFFLFPPCVFPFLVYHATFVTTSRVEMAGFKQKCLPANYLQFLIFIRPLSPHFWIWMNLHNNDYLAQRCVNNWLVPASCANFTTTCDRLGFWRRYCWWYWCQVVWRDLGVVRLWQPHHQNICMTRKEGVVHLKYAAISLSPKQSHP